MILIISSSLVLYAFVNLIPGTCPLVHWTANPVGIGPMPFNIFSTEELHGADAGTGRVSWCIYNGNPGTLTKNYQTNKVLGEVDASGDGSAVVATAWRIAPGPSGYYENGSIYFFNNIGNILWNYELLGPGQAIIFSAELSHNASIVVAFNPTLYYFNRNGTLLWSNSTRVSSARLVNDGARIVAASSSGADLESGLAVVMYDNTGRIVWNHPINESSAIFDSSNSIAVSPTRIAAGTAGGFDHGGTLYCLDLLGHLQWTAHVGDTGALDVFFVRNNQVILVKTNQGSYMFDLNGNPVS